MRKYNELKEQLHKAENQLSKYMINELLDKIGNNNSINLEDEENLKKTDYTEISIGVGVLEDEYDDNILTLVSVEDNELYFKTSSYTYNIDEITTNELTLVFEIIMQILNIDID